MGDCHGPKKCVPTRCAGSLPGLHPSDAAALETVVVAGGGDSGGVVRILVLVILIDQIFNQIINLIAKFAARRPRPAARANRPARSEWWWW